MSSRDASATDKFEADAVFEKGREDSRKVPLPPRFCSFLKENGMDQDVYEAKSIPRYIRMVKGHDDVSLVEQQIGTRLEPVPWMPRFFALPHDFRIVDTLPYRNGMIFGMDVSSAAAVDALDLQEGDDVLDLCCAPGAKLLLISEIVGRTGSVTGVDFSKERATTCRSLMKKFKYPNIRLYNRDGTTFDIPPPVKIDTSVENPLFGHSKTKRRRVQENHDLLYSGMMIVKDTTNEIKSKYDKVIVDAECTHDGSIKHVQKFDFWGWETFEERFFNQERINSLQSLQRNLLLNGYRMCKEGGIVVYSTCSFAKTQNEDIVEWLLSQEETARVLAISRSSEYPHKKGFLEHTVRFDPISSGTSGLFVARILKSRTPELLDKYTGPTTVE